MERNAPLYHPAARRRVATSALRRRGRQAGQSPSAASPAGAAGSGRPQLKQSGGVIRSIRRQHSGHTTPRVGRSRRTSHAAQPGAQMTLRMPSASRSADAAALTTAPADQLGSDTGIRVALPHRRSRS